MENVCEKRNLVESSSVAWATLKQRFKMPNPLVLHVTEVMHDQHYHQKSPFKNLNPELQQHYYKIVEATMKALGKL